MRKSVCASFVFPRWLNTMLNTYQMHLGESVPVWGTKIRLCIQVLLLRASVTFNKLLALSAHVWSEGVSMQDL